MNLLATTIFSVLVWISLVTAFWLWLFVLIQTNEYTIEDEADEALSILRNN